MIHTKERLIFTEEQLPQGSDAWKDARRARLSSTKSKTAGAGSKNLDAINNTVALLSAELAPDYEAPNVNTKAMQHGTKYEPEADKFYIENLMDGAEVAVSVGLVQKTEWSGMVILSPDKLIAKTTDVVTDEAGNIDVNATRYTGACEYKCREQKAFDKFSKTKVIPASAMHQIRHYFLTMEELEWVDYGEYNPFETPDKCFVKVRVLRSTEAKKIEKLKNRVDEVHNIMYNESTIIEDTGTTEEVIVEEEEVVIATPETALDTTVLSSIDLGGLVKDMNTIEVEVLTHLGRCTNIPDVLTSANNGKIVTLRKETNKLRNKVEKLRKEGNKPIKEFIDNRNAAYKSIASKLDSPIEDMDIVIDAYEVKIKEEQEKKAREAQEALDVLKGERYNELILYALPMEIELLQLDTMSDELYNQYLDMYKRRSASFGIIPNTPPPASIEEAIVRSRNEAVHASTPEHVATGWEDVTTDPGSVYTEEIVDCSCPAPEVAIDPIGLQLEPAKYNEYLNFLAVMQGGLTLPIADCESAVQMNSVITERINEVITYIKFNLGM